MSRERGPRTRPIPGCAVNYPNYRTRSSPDQAIASASVGWPTVVGCGGLSRKRPLPDSNRGWRICNPQHPSPKAQNGQHFRRRHSCGCTEVAQNCPRTWSVWSSPGQSCPSTSDGPFSPWPTVAVEGHPVQSHGIFARRADPRASPCLSAASGHSRRARLPSPRKRPNRPNRPAGGASCGALPGDRAGVRAAGAAVLAGWGLAVVRLPVQSFFTRRVHSSRRARMSAVPS